MIHLLYVCTVNYLKLGQPALESARTITGVKRWLVCYKFQPTDYLRRRYPHLECVHLPETPYECNNMVQAGQWLDVLPGVADDDIIIMSDADIVAQRDITAAERARFANYDDNTLGLAWNGWAGDTLHDEAERIWLMPQEPWMKNVPCYNCGLIVGRVGAWKRLRADFERDAVHWFGRSQNRCKIQWVINFCLARAGVRVDVLDSRIHTHGHFELPSGVAVRDDGVAYAGEDVIMFRHKF